MFSLRSFIHKLCHSFTLKMWTTHTEICSSGLIRQEAQSSCSDTTAELLIKQCIAHWEHCKPQLIRVCPLYFINTYCCGLNLKQISMLVLHHFLLNLCMFPVPWLKVSDWEREKGEVKRNDLHAWAVWWEEGREGIGQLLLGNHHKHRKKSHKPLPAAWCHDRNRHSAQDASKSPHLHWLTDRSLFLSYILSDS